MSTEPKPRWNVEKERVRAKRKKGKDPRGRVVAAKAATTSALPLAVSPEFHSRLFAR